MLSPDQRFLYVAAGESGLAGYRRSRASGRLRPVPGARGCFTATAFDEDLLQWEDRRAVRACIRSPLLGGPSFGTLGMAISPDGRYLYVAGNLYSRTAPHTYDADGTVLVLQRSRRHGTLQQTGCLTEHGEPPCQALRGVESLAELAMSPDGRSVYIGGNVPGETGPASGIAVLSRDPVGGGLTQLGGPSGCIAPPGFPGCDQARGLNEGTSTLAVSPDGKNVYLAGSDATGRGPHPGTLAIFRRDPVTGVLGQVPGEAGCLASDRRDGCAFGRHLGTYPENVPGIAVSPDGRSAYAVFTTVSSGGLVSGGLGVYRRDPSTGALTELPGPRGCLSAHGRGGCTPARAVAYPHSVTVSTDGRNVYVSAFNSHSVAVFLRPPGGGALRQPGGSLGCISSNQGPVIPGPLGGEFNVDEGCAAGKIDGSDFELSRDGAYGYAPGEGRIAIAARNAPRIRLRLRPRRCLTANTRALVVVRSYAPLGRVTVRLDGEVIAENARRRLRLRVSPARLHRRRNIRLVAVDTLGRRGVAKRTLRNCAR
jgi:DNA-binding beta-propeller fold protein YncE